MNVCETVHLARIGQREGGAHHPAGDRNGAIRYTESSVRQADV